jgi:hypothetical protein
LPRSPSFRLSATIAIMTAETTPVVRTIDGHSVWLACHSHRGIAVRNCSQMRKRCQRRHAAVTNHKRSCAASQSTRDRSFKGTP